MHTLLPSPVPSDMLAAVTLAFHWSELEDSGLIIQESQLQIVSI